VKILPIEPLLELSSKGGELLELSSKRLELSSKRGRSKSRGSSKGSRKRGGSTRSESADDGGVFEGLATITSKSSRISRDLKGLGNTFNPGVVMPADDIRRRVQTDRLAAGEGDFCFSELVTALANSKAMPESKQVINLLSEGSESSDSSEKSTESLTQSPPLKKAKPGKATGKVFPVVHKAKTDREPVVFNKLDNFLNSDGADGWIDRVRKGVESKSATDPDVFMDEGLLEMVNFVGGVSRRDTAKQFALSTETKGKKFGTAYAQAHAPGCLAQWRKGSKNFTVKFFSSEDVEGGVVTAITAFSCCANLWTPGFTVGKFMESKFYWAAQCLKIYLNPALCDQSVKTRHTKALENPIFKAMVENGFATFDLCQYLGVGGNFFDRVVHSAIILEGRKNIVDPGIPAFRAITDRKRAFRANEVVEDFPLLSSGRLQLNLSKEFIEKSLPGMHQKLLELMGARDIVYSLLYSEGVNYLRYDKDFQLKVKEKGKVIPNRILSKEDVVHLVGDNDATWFFEGLQQTAHKDTVRGYFSEDEAQMPNQMIISIESLTTFYVWEKEGKGCLKTWSTGTEWEEKEVGKGFGQKALFLHKGHAVFFHGKQTHAGAGLNSGFRIFAGAVRTPGGKYGYSWLSHNQAYYQLKTPEEDFGGYRMLTDFIGADEDHSDAQLYSGWLASRGGSLEPDRTEYAVADLRVPREAKYSNFYTHILKEWALHAEKMKRREARLNQSEGLVIPPTE
jgi:hypothetical protein